MSTDNNELMRVNMTLGWRTRNRVLNDSIELIAEHVRLQPVGLAPREPHRPQPARSVDHKLRAVELSNWGPAIKREDFSCVGITCCAEAGALSQSRIGRNHNSLHTWNCHAG